jgi:hypothetical protein
MNPLARIVPSGLLLALAMCSQEVASQQRQQEPELSAAAKLVVPAFQPSKGEVRAFCGYIAFKYNNSTAFGDENVIREAKYFEYLKQGGYVTELPDTWSPTGLAGLRAISGTVEYRFSPTDKLWGLADRRDGDCFYYNTILNSNIRVANEVPHPLYKSVSTVYLQYDRTVSRYMEVYYRGHGLPGSGKTMARALVVENPVSRQPQMRRLDIGADQTGWSSETVPQAYAIINVGGPDAIK